VTRLSVYAGSGLYDAKWCYLGTIYEECLVVFRLTREREMVRDTWIELKGQETQLAVLGTASESLYTQADTNPNLRDMMS
jgi:hypothetical protein